MAGLAHVGSSTIVGYKPALHGIFAYVEERGKERMEKWALMQEPTSTYMVEHWERHLYRGGQELGDSHRS